MSTWCLCNIICSKCDIVLYTLPHEMFYFRYLYVNIIQVCIAKGLLGSMFVPACASFDILLCFDVFCTTSKQRNIPIQHVSTFKNMTSSLNYVTTILRTFLRDVIQTFYQHIANHYLYLFRLVS